MTTKPSRLITEILAAILTIFGAAACSTTTVSNPEIQPAVTTSNNPATSPVTTAPSLTDSAPKTSQPTITTIFKCIQQPNGWATVAQRGNAVSQNPLLTWNSTEFGDEWTPEQRCQTVSKRLTDAVAKNGGKLARLDLTTGNVDNGYTVVCMVTAGQKSCDRKNMLFTLNKENKKAPSEVLATITNFASGNATTKSVAENAPIPQFIPLETLVNSSLGKENGF
ncbi:MULTISPECIES: COP23 domain-containing protein [unclassified Microcoleus]|uniref:COP23 domain-containing protein n=1 Tax=unclassified Microcoleus TaxID=2642155 RepID=UPI002FD02BE4